MASSSNAIKTLLAVVFAMTLGAVASSAPAAAGSDDDDDWGDYGWSGVHEPYFDHPVRVVRRTIIIERQTVHRPVVYRHYAPRRAYWPRPVDEPWHERRRCWLPERYLCR
jgi:hypothetical protein